MISIRRRYLFPFIVPLLALTGCGDGRLTEYQLSGPTMGTQFNITVVTDSEFDQLQLQTRIQATLEDIDRHMSTYREDSELARFNRSISTEPISVSRRLCEAVDRSLQLGDLTSGAFDVTVGPLVNLW